MKSNIRQQAARPARARSSTWIVLLATSLVSCQQKMAEQPKYTPLKPSAFFENGRSARPLVPGTVAQGQLRLDEPFFTGKSGGELVRAFPLQITREVLERGRERFNIFCAPCHDRVGTGEGMIVQRGYRRPPSYHIDRLLEAPVGHFFDVITNGFGAMPDYAAQVPPRDRWAITAYIRALQLSQHAALSALTQEERQRLLSLEQ